MNDRCTTATARRLREQGFPQPVPAPGQVWYDTEGGDCFVFGVNGSYVMLFYLQDDFQTAAIPIHFLLSHYAYAPTNQDILRELGSGFALTIHPEAIGGNCFCMQFMPAAITTVWVHAEWQHENPAEACAEAWEAKQKQG